MKLVPLIGRRFGLHGRHEKQKLTKRHQWMNHWWLWCEVRFSISFFFFRKEKIKATNSVEMCCDSYRQQPQWIRSINFVFFCEVFLRFFFKFSFPPFSYLRQRFLLPVKKKRKRKKPPSPAGRPPFFFPTKNFLIKKKIWFWSISKLDRESSTPETETRDVH